MEIEKCPSYISTKHYVATFRGTPIYSYVNQCYRTKEKEDCLCGGDRSKCEVKEKNKDATSVESLKAKIAVLTENI